MLEYVTDAIVLDKVDLKEQDSRVFLFTKDFGKVVAKITSGRKIISKLASHTEPLCLSMVRIVDKNSPQLIDALSYDKIISNRISFKIAALLREISPEYQPDPELWDLLSSLVKRESEENDFVEVLKISGFDPVHARCNNCLRGVPDFFSVKDLVFYCKHCYAG